MKLIVNNRTHWKTAHLRQFILRTLRQERADLFKRQPYTVTFRCNVRYNRQGNRGTRCSGHAPIGGNWMRVMLPSGNPDKTDLAMVCAHEAAHTAGVGHNAMRGDPFYHRVGNYREIHGWAESLPLERQERRARAAIADRLAHAQRMLLRARTRAKRASTIERRWTRRVKTLTTAQNRSSALI